MHLESDLDLLHELYLKYTILITRVTTNAPCKFHGSIR